MFFKNTILLSFSIFKTSILYYNIFWIIMKYYALFSGSTQCRSIIDRFMQMEDKNEITSGIYR